MDYILLAVVVEFPDLQASRTFIEDFEARLRHFQVLSCDWQRYPKFQEAFWYNWYLQTDLAPDIARKELRSIIGPDWAHFPDGSIWNRDESVPPEAQPLRWAHLYGEEWVTQDVIRKLERGPTFHGHPGPFISVSSDGELTGIYRGDTDEPENLDDR